MPLDPQCAAILAMMPDGRGEMTDETIGQVRIEFGMLSAAGVSEPPAIESARDADADGVPVRIYTPLGGTTPRPVVVYFHGGGWTIGSVADYDALTRLLAARSEAIVVSVDYRLAPEHPHPAAVDDCYTALAWVASHAAEFGGDPNRIAVAGDSAGGNLSAVMAHLTRQRGGPELVLQALIYPVTDCDFDRASYLDNGKGYFLERDSMRYFFDAYCRGGTPPETALVSPLHSNDLSGLAPALVITAEFDPLRDEGEEYADALRTAGVAVESQRYDGMIHGFVAMPALLDGGRAANEHIVGALRRAFGTL